ncbi:MAG: 2-amino-4-hydroxy-6-hydroxymethyldihydropteridine diphosphokinase [Bacteroidales bacterium]|nr:2-amino-4-hydroxy-6-hydroxymethyldihydropteridine diphosphokinase [Bacteroidales bacterium]
MASESVLILLGSNMGDREALIDKACDMIAGRCGLITAKSGIYESEPWGFEAEQWFLNQVIQLTTALEPDELMGRLLSIEKELGRDRSIVHQGYASRPMDLDILYFGDQIVDTQMVTAPHPRLQQRRFTLLPLCDVAADMLHPVLKLTNRQLLECCQDEGKVKLYK